MGTCVFPCGCFITTSMFEDRLVISVYACAEHYSDEEVQAALVALAGAVRKAAGDHED
jgi:hypothetical protein